MGHYTFISATFIALDMKWWFADELPICQNWQRFSTFCQIGDYRQGLNMQNPVQYSQVRACFLYYIIVPEENVISTILPFS